LTYVVQPGDSLWSIAARFGVSVQAIASANQITNPHAIYVGQTLTIPTTPSPTFPGPAVPSVPSVPSPVRASMEERIAKLEREFNQFVTIIDHHRQQIAELSRRLQRIEPHA
jgi:LysM repeat protein